MDEKIDAGCNFSIRARKNESMENLIRRFFKKQKKEGLIEELINRKRFKKNATLRRELLHRRALVLKRLKELDLQTDD